MQSTRCISRRMIYTACTDCNTCTGGGGSYSCGNNNDGAYIVDPKCGQTKDPKTSPDGGHYDASTGIYTGPDGSQAQVGPDGPAC